MKNVAACTLVVLLLEPTGLSAKKIGTKDGRAVESTRTTADGLWKQPSDIKSRNLFYGPGGKDHQPGKTLTFVKEVSGGSNPKIIVKDENGVTWKVKLGTESRPETVASRLVWAVGYHADEDYWSGDLHVQQLPAQLHRGQNLVHAGGVFHDARLKREEEDLKKVNTWSWRNPPFAGTREFNGLRVMMALLNNWDLKDENNAIYEEDKTRIYEVSDLGATLGSSGVHLIKTTAKGNRHAFQSSKFITKTDTEYVDFGSPALPSLPYLFNPFQYARRARLRWIGRHVNRADAKWMGQLLGQLSTSQIEDAFRAAGYSGKDIAGFTQTLQKRIAELNAL